MLVSWQILIKQPTPDRGKSQSKPRPDIHSGCAVTRF
jgi:hypothetical protein